MKRLTTDKQNTNCASSKRRRLCPSIRRVELLEAALDVLRDRGPTNARVEDVTNAAGTAKGTFYLYFSSWDDLLVEVRAHLLSKYKSEMQERFLVETSSDWWVAFEQECIHVIDFIIELGDLHKAIFHGPMAEHPIDAAISANTFFAEMLCMGIKCGVCRPVEPDTAAKFLFSVLHTAADGMAQTDDRERYLKTMLDLLRTWLRSPVPATTKQEISSHGEGVANV